MLNIKTLHSGESDFYRHLDKLLARDVVTDRTLNSLVGSILDSVRELGDEAVLEYTRKFDRLDVDKFSDLVVTGTQIDAAYQRVPENIVQALEKAADRIRMYHERQLIETWTYTENDGTILGQKVTPLGRVGLYVPGGKAAYPSSVLMNAIPAKVANVDSLVMVVPAPDNHLNDMVLAAARIAGIDEIYKIGGAQAIAALAYGTESLRKVDKIVGPGNQYVAAAKGMVYGVVGIDMIAGPSEILVICDGKTSPDWIAMDLFSQAEHDEQAQSILVCPDKAFVDQVNQSIAKLLPDMERKDIIEQSLRHKAIFIHVKDLQDAAQISNYVAPEHLELSVENPESLLESISNAGAVFMGRYTAEAIGDYCAGPNHVLPTSGTARFSSPLGVYDFQKRSSLINCSSVSAQTYGHIASVLARGEGLTAHARSAEYRIPEEKQ